MAITFTINPSETLVRSGQAVPFMLEVTNTDGSDRTLSALYASPSPGPGGFSGRVDAIAKSPGITLPDSATTYIPFNGVFFASQSNLVGDASSSTVSFVLNAEVQNLDGEITQNSTTAVCSMSVIPQGSTIPNQYLGPYSTLDFQSNNNGIQYLLYLAH